MCVAFAARCFDAISIAQSAALLVHYGTGARRCTNAYLEYFAVSPYLSQKLTRPLPTKDGGTLRTVLEARAYMLVLSKDRERRTQWQRAAELLLAQANVADFSKQVELALFFDAKL